MVNVKYRGALAELTGKPRETINALNVKGVLRYIESTYGKAPLKAAKTMLITVNGESIVLLKSYNTLLAEGDELAFYPICGGG